MNTKRLTWLPLSLVLLGQAICALPSANAGNYDLGANASTASLGKDNGVSEGGFFGRQRFTLTFDSRFGYDDNTLGQPETTTFINAAGKTIQQHIDASESAFLNFSLGVGYTIATPRLTLVAGADLGVNYFFDRPGRDYDVNGGLSVRMSYKLSPRAVFDLSTYNAYESQGDYGATGLTNFNGQFGGSGRASGTTAQLNGDYFYTANRIGLAYQFTPRVSATFSNNLVAFAYDSDPYSTVQDRIETYPAIEAGYLVLPNLTLALTYRFGYINYFNVSNDSLTHFVLTGFDYSANQRLHASVRVGAEFREYTNAAGDEVSPYAEGNITYDISRDSHVSFSLRYSIEEGDLAIQNTSADTFRIGLNFTQNVTSRISAYLGTYYTHSFYNTPTTNNAGSFAENTYDVSAGARYAINRHLSAEIGYTFTTVDSDIEFRTYDRNRVFAGVRLSF